MSYFTNNDNKWEDLNVFLTNWNNRMNEFHKVKEKPNDKISKDIDEFFRNYPSDLVRIKYERLLEEIKGA